MNNCLKTSYVRKLQAIAYNFLKFCTNKSPKTGKKFSNDYWRVYNFLYKDDNIQPKIQSLYEYALHLEKNNPGQELMSLTQFIQNAEKWRVHLIKQAENARAEEIKKQADIPKYKEFSLADLENL